MPTSDFDNLLNQALDFSAAASDPYGKSYDELSQISNSIERKLNDGLTGNPIQVEIEPGFQANMGQQLRVNIRIPSKQFRDTLFRAYVPIDGWPIYLDLFGELPEECDTIRELQEKILDFLAKIKDRMSSYREYAQQ